MTFRKITLALAAVATSFALNARADITTGLVGYWTFDDGSGSATAADSAPEGDTGVLTNFSDTTFTSMWTPGRIGGALTFNANGDLADYVAISNNADLNFTNGLQFTLSAWVNSALAGASQISGAAIISHGLGNGGEQYTMDLNSGKFRFYVRNAAGTVSQMTSGTAPAAGTWYHVAAVYSGQAANKQQIFYLNGISNTGIATASVPVNLRYSTNLVTIGNRMSSSTLTSYTLGWKGMIDDVHVYNRALTSNDIFQLYAANGNAPIISTQPRSVSAYVGDYPAFSVTINTALSIVPISYQWQLNGTNIPGATAATFVVTNAQLINAGTYTVITTNYVGTNVSSNAVLSLQSLPPADSVTGLVGYWKFDDGSGSSTAADSSANDNPGALTGFADTTFTSMWTTNGLIGGALAFNGDGTALNVVAVPGIGAPAPAVLDFSGSPMFTLAAWIHAPATQTNGAGIIAKGNGGGGEQYVIDIDAGHYRFYVRDTNGVAFNALSTIAPNGLWQHVAAAFNASNGIMNLYVNGQLATVGIAPFSVISNSHEMTIGNRQAASAGYSNAFTGVLDDVHIYNRDLTSADVYALYLLGGAFAPAIVTAPVGASLYVGDNVQFSALASGTAPLAYQWRQNGTNIPGATTSTLAFRPTVAANAGTYVLVITNLYGAVTSSPAILGLTPFNLTNALAAYWTFDDGPGSCTAADSSTNGNNANLLNFPDCTSEWVTGRINDCLTFNTTTPTNEYLDVPYAPSLSFNTNLVFSLSAWVRGSATQPNGACILAKGVGGVSEEYAMDVETGTFRFYVRNVTSNSTALLSPIAPNGTWQQVVATYDGNVGVMDVYVNGQLAATAATPTTLLGENSHDLTIGCREASASSGFSLPFNGLIDDVRIYSRALSSNDVLALYQSAPLFAPVFYTQPQSASLYVGNNYTLSAAVDGSVPLGVQWQFDGANIAGATNSTLTLTNLQTANSGTYNLLLSNVVAGPLSSANAVLQVSVFNLANVVGWWKFDDGTNSPSAADSSSYGDIGTLNGFPDFGPDWWVPGRIQGALNFEVAASTGDYYQTYVSIPDAPQLNFTNGLSFSLAAWVKAPTAQTASAGIICKGYSGAEQYAIDINTGAYRFFVRSGPGVASQAQSSVAPNGLWQHLVAVCDANVGTLNLYINGVLQNAGVAPATLLGGSHEVSVGARESSASSGYNLLFDGVVDDVRIYSQPLNATEVMALYQSAPAFAPVFYTQPQGSTNYSGTSVTFTALADASAPAGYQWLLNSNAIPGATNLTLTLNYLQTNNSGAYTLEVTNSAGTNFSQDAVLLVIPIHFTGGTFLNDGTFQLNLSGEPNASFTLYSTANVSLPLAQWTILQYGLFDGNGQATYIDANAANNPSQFYYLQVQLQ